MQTIKNDELRVRVSPVGAEIQSVECLKSGRECLWQGDAAWWSGRSPILFPACGGLWDGTYRHQGTARPMTKHGFVRRATWQLTASGDDFVTYAYTGTVGNYETFPFAFRLVVTYRLEGHTLTATYRVENHGGAPLPFQLGSHPALALPGWDEANDVDGYLRLEGRADYVLRAGTQGCVTEERFAVPRTDDGLVPLSVATFANEALIFPEGQITAATLLDRDRRPFARIESAAPVWLFWSPQGQHTPFVCCEPWYGLCDFQGFAGDVFERPYVQTCPPYDSVELIGWRLEL